MKKIIIIGIIINVIFFIYNFDKSANNKANQTPIYKPYNPKSTKINSYYRKKIDKYIQIEKGNGRSKMCVKDIKKMSKWVALFAEDDQLLKNRNVTLLRIIKKQNNYMRKEQETFKELNKYDKTQIKQLLNHKIKMHKYIPVFITIAIAGFLGFLIFLWAWIIANKEKDLIQRKSEIELLEKKADRTYKQAEKAIKIYKEKEAKLSSKEKEVEKSDQYIRKNIDAWRSGINDIQAENNMLSQKYTKVMKAFEDCCGEVERMKEFVQKAYGSNKSKIKSVCRKIDEKMEEIKQEAEK